MADQPTLSTLKIEPNKIYSGGVVKFTVEVKDPPPDWKTSGYKIDWYINDVYVLSASELETDPNDPTTVKWDTIHVQPLSGKNVSVSVTAQLVKDGKSVGSQSSPPVDLEVMPRPTVTITVSAPPSPPVTEGAIVSLEANIGTVSIDDLQASNIEVKWSASGKLIEPDPGGDPLKLSWNTTGMLVGSHEVTVKLVNKRGTVIAEAIAFIEVRPRPLSEKEVMPVALQRTSTQSTRDQALWVAIRNRTKAIAFSGSGYKSFIDAVLCEDKLARSKILERQRGEYGQVELDSTKPGEYTPIVAGVGAYELLKTATEVFLLLNCGVTIRNDDLVAYDPTEEVTRLGAVVPLGEVQSKLEDYLGAPKQLPYLKRIINNVFPGKKPTDKVHCEGILIQSRVEKPCLLELIWSYWHEEGMLVQAINAISLRFQNLRSGSGQDPLAHLEIDPIRPLNNVLWGYIQDEQHRLTVQRRAYEYDHHYGLTLYGKAIPSLRSADSRSKFLEAYHNLLHLCPVFYAEDDDTTRIADAFPLLNALKETHLILAQGAHNQFGDLPWTARAEMLMQEWLLARSEMRDFLQSRPMVPYQEGWMAQVDTMKKLQGWSDVSVMHFRDLGVYGEQILLSVRYGNWIDINDPAQAANWARYWRPEIQSYIHAYRAVTGVDLSAEITTTQQRELITTKPSVLLRQRLPAGQMAPALPAGGATAMPQGFRERRAARRLTRG